MRHELGPHRSVEDEDTLVQRAQKPIHLRLLRRRDQERLPAAPAEVRRRGRPPGETRGMAPSPIVETRGLSKSFAGYCAVDDVSLSIEAGTIHAIIGPNGAGKTTFFNLLSGFVKPSAGTISLRGSDITGLSPSSIARLGMVRSFQINSIFTHLSVLDNVKVSLESKTDLPVRFWSPGTATKRLEPRAKELLADVGLERENDLLAVQLSYGRKARARTGDLARARSRNPARSTSRRPAWEPRTSRASRA